MCSEVRDCLFKGFILSFFAFIDKHGVSDAVKPLLPFIDGMIKMVSKFNYFRQPLQMLKPFLEKKFDIHFEIPVNNDNFLSVTGTNMTFLQTIY